MLLWASTFPLAWLLHRYVTFRFRSAKRVFNERYATFARSDAEVPTLDAASIRAFIAQRVPPGVPHEVVLVRTKDLAKAFGDKATMRYSPLDRAYKCTHAGLPGTSAAILVLYCDVAADYYVENVSWELCKHINARHKDKTIAFFDNDFFLVKETATAAGLGTIGKNSLFFSNRFGFNCKVNVIQFHAELDAPDDLGLDRGSDGWKMTDCTTCTACVDACPVGAFDDFRMQKHIACDRVISADFFGGHRTQMCRACITSCPPSTDLLKRLRRDGAPRLKFWDDEQQLNFVSDLLRGASWFQWLYQKFYYGAGIPGRRRKYTVDYRRAFTAEPQSGWVSLVRDAQKNNIQLPVIQQQRNEATSEKGETK
jgi:ferredoxin